MKRMKNSPRMSLFFFKPPPPLRSLKLLHLYPSRSPLVSRLSRSLLALLINILPPKLTSRTPLFCFPPSAFLYLLYLLFIQHLCLPSLSSLPLNLAVLKCHSPLGPFHVITPVLDSKCH